MKFTKIALAAAACLSMLAPHAASAADLSSRVGVMGVMWTSDSADDVFGGGVSAGATLSFEKAYLDANLEAVQASVRLPNNAPGVTTQADGWRSEVSLAAGVPIWNTFSVFAGYRKANYGLDFGSSDSATLNGGFVGMAVSNLTMPGDDKNLFSFSFALQPTKFKIKATGETEDDVGVSIKFGYRHAGSPHSVALRYQSFGGDKSYSEYVTTLQYLYNF